MKMDGRKISHQALEEIRTRAVQQVRAGASPEAVIAALGFDRRTIYKWLARFNDGGLPALKAKPLMGRPTLLLPKHIQWLFKTVRKDPRQLYFSFALWTREMLREALERKFGVFVSRQTIGRTLKKLGITCQKPLHRAIQQDPVAVKRWLDEEYPSIKDLAEKEGADIYFEDEAGIRSDFHAGTTWGEKGNTPVVKSTGARFGVNMLSAVNPKGEMRFMVYDGNVNGEVFITFLKRMLVGAERPIFLVVDGHPAHRAVKVKKFVEGTEGRLRLFTLPPYSPELNPDELVWNVVKSKVGRSGVKKKSELKERVTSSLRGLQRNPKQVKALFQEKHVRYAAL